MLRHDEDIEKIHALTREDVRRLRAANRISFHRSPTSSRMTAALDESLAAGTKTKWEHEIPVHSTIKECRGHKEPDTRRPLAEVASCHHLIWYADSIHEPFRTIASLLKVGDRIELQWTRDAHTNQYMERANLHGDRLQLIIHRSNKKPMLFLVHSQCCENNTARLIRRGPHNNE